MKLVDKFKEGRLHYSWIIMIACCAIYGGTMGVGYNCIGLFNAAIARDMGMTISGFSSTNIFMGASSALMLLFADRIFRKCDVRAVLCISEFLYALSLVLRAVCTEYWQFALVHVLTGAACAFLFYVPVPMLINAWFKEKAATALSVAMLSSGIIGAVCNTAIGSVIAAQGWREAAVVNGVISALITLPVTFLFVRKTPAEVGLKPYGYRQTALEAFAHPDEKRSAGKISLKDVPADKKRKLAASFVLAFLVFILSTAPQQMAHYAQVNGLSVTVGATLATAGMLGNMSGKALMGGLMDRIGSRKTLSVTFTLAAIGAFMLAYLSKAPLFVLYIAIALAAMAAGNNVIAMPIVVRSFSDGDEYVTFMSKVSVATMIGTALSTYLNGALYDLTGSYVFEYTLFGVLTFVALFMALAIIGKKGNTQ